MAQRLPDRRDAERALSEIVASVHGGAYVEPTRQTLKDFTADWLAAIEPTVRPATHYSYARNLRLHVLPQLGPVQLRRLDAGMLNGLYAALLADGKQFNGGGGLSPRSVSYVHTIVHRALRDAVRWGRIPRNPADAADPLGRRRQYNRLSGPGPPSSSVPSSTTWQTTSCLRRSWCWRRPACAAASASGCAGRTWT